MRKTSAHFWFSCFLVLLLLGVVVLAQPVMGRSLLDYSNYLPYVNNPETPTPTLKPTATLTPTPTRTPLPPGVTVKPNYSSFLTSWGTLHLVGEVYNDTSSTLTNLNISVKFFDNHNKLLATETTPLYLNDLPPNDKSCFDVILSSPPKGWSSYTFSAVTYDKNGTPLPDVLFLSQSGSYDSSSGEYTIEGQVRNDDGARLECAMIVGTLYNGSGKVIGCSYSYVSNISLSSGYTANYEVEFYGRDYHDVDAFQVQADAIKH